MIAAACGGNDPSPIAYSTPYPPGQVFVAGEGEGGKEFPKPGSCTYAACDSVSDQCGPDGAADVIVDAQGNLLDVICYGQDVTVNTVPTDVVGNVDAGNNTVVVIDGADDGADVTGDLVISGNNAIVYGNGPDVSVIQGTVVVEKNNAKIRGVRIQGDVTIDKNNTKMVLCVIEGNLTINGNNTTIAACDVYGTITVNGNNTVLVEDRVAGAVSGKNLTCASLTRIDDVDGDFVIDEGEISGPVTCG